MAKAILLFANFFTALKHGAIPGQDHGLKYALARDCIACPSIIKTTTAGFVIRVVSTHLVQASLVQGTVIKSK
jgi:hypothetical protein